MLTFKRIAATALILLATVLGPAANAGALEDGLAGLGEKDFKARIAAVEALGASGDDRASVILEALVAGQLFFRKDDGKAVIAVKSGSVYVLTDAITGEDSGEAVKKEL